MKIFLDTANTQSISQWSYLIDGITTNPSTLSHEQKNPTKQVLEICSLMSTRDVSIEVTETDPQAVYEQAHKIAHLAPNVVVKIPCYRAYYPTIKKLVEEGIHLNITLIFSLCQGFYMSKLGVRYISPFVGRIEDNGGNGIELIYRLRTMLDQYDYPTELLAASLRTVDHVQESLEAGADCATLPPELLKKTTEHILTDKGMELFNQDWAKLGINNFPQP